MNELPTPRRSSSCDTGRRHALRMLGPLAALAALPLPTVAEPPAPAGASPARRPAEAARDAAISQHFPFGPVAPPRPAGRWMVSTHDGRTAELASLLRGRVSAVQFIFTGCSAVCPIEGALFAQAQQSTAGMRPAAQFVSISVDPLSDSPSALAAWLQRMGAGPGWLAVAPRVHDVQAIVDHLAGQGDAREGRLDTHTGRIFIFDRSAALVYRTPSLPPAREIADRLRETAARAG